MIIFEIDVSSLYIHDYVKEVKLIINIENNLDSPQNKKRIGTWDNSKLKL